MREFRTITGRVKPENLVVAFGAMEAPGSLEGFFEFPTGDRSNEVKDPLDYYWRGYYGEFAPFQFGNLKGGTSEWDAELGIKRFFCSSEAPLVLAVRVSLPGTRQIRQGRFIHFVAEDGTRCGELEFCNLSSCAIEESPGENPESSVYSFGTRFEFDLTIRVRTSDFVINDRSFALLSETEEFRDKVPVRYLTIPGTSDEVAFVFSAMSSVGDLTFNYKSSLANFSGTQYFILDDAREQGTYYLCEGRDFSVADSVQRFIRSVLEDRNTPSDSVYFFGSSKGATAAVWHALRLGFGNAVVAAPQFLIGDFLKRPHPGILHYMAGGRSYEDVEWLNGLFARTLDPSTFGGSIRILVGDNDPHKDTHVPALVRFLTDAKADVLTLPVLGANHAETGVIYASMLRSFSDQKGDEVRSFYALSAKDKCLQLSCAPHFQNSTMAVRLYVGANEFAMEWYGRQNTWKWDNVPEGSSVVFRVYEKAVGENGDMHAYTTRRIEMDDVQKRKY
ncbi:hypothetical protein ACKFRZ_03665 [Corynebacterium gottingense]|uniref:hypothetical protein n=1 Tax=Corynebacterium gottingense TaxID=2041036 RepID=UPI0038CF2C75